MSATVPRSSTAIDGEKAGTSSGLISSGVPQVRPPSVERTSWTESNLPPEKSEPS
ncbi:hypothetical protein [Streptomyces sp. NBC_00162]|uniref:hypothetical protein n=1 Tax=Streptomyces sp. NBC_00162 TaxID=2903629 RepID=UPI00214CFA5C|nr:hypothetical protein [Streptomyces sp. NBC_00162]UUU44156.1 hypothetical protein JIW86_38505 [Streptomyces sp. NBC_00162]